MNRYLARFGDPKLLKKGFNFLRRHGFKKTLIKVAFPYSIPYSICPGRTWTNADHTRGYSYKENFDEAKINNEITSFKQKPLISIVVPVYNIDPHWLNLAIESVKRQFYANWELCLADDASTNQKTIDYMKQLSHPRIKVTFCPHNQGISGASNAAIEMATGEYIALLDNDDELTRDALFEVVKRINNDGAEFIYSDEDLMDVSGRCYNPHFKSDFNPDLLRCHNYITHFSVIRKTIIDRLGGFRSKFNGAQDYDLILRVVDQTDKIAHVPKVLYHWRTLPSSTSSNPGSKNYADKAGKDALLESFQRNHIPALATYGNAPFYYMARRKIIGKPKVSIIIPFKDRPDFLERSIESILIKTPYENYEIIGVNNRSTDKMTLQVMKELAAVDSRVRFIDYDLPFNYSAINNLAVNEFATGEQILLLNNDTTVINADWLTALLEHSQREEVGAVGGKLIYPHGTIQHAGVFIGIGTPPELAVAGHLHRGVPKDYHGYYNRVLSVQNVSAVTGACLMVKKSLYQALGGLNEKELKVAYNDVDFCLRLREQGFLNVYTPYCEIYHFESISRGQEHEDKERMDRFIKEINYMRTRHKNIIMSGDPYYNPNLSRLTEDFAMTPIDN